MDIKNFINNEINYKDNIVDKILLLLETKAISPSFNLEQAIGKYYLDEIAIKCKLSPMDFYNISTEAIDKFNERKKDRYYEEAQLV